MGKIIQIAITGHLNTPQTQSDWTLIALCDDGRLWGMNSTGCWAEIPLPIVPIPKRANHNYKAATVPKPSVLPPPPPSSFQSQIGKCEPVDGYDA